MVRETVVRLLREFGDRVDIFLVKKDFEANTVEGIVEVTQEEQIDQIIKERYSKEELNSRL